MVISDSYSVMTVLYILEIHVHAATPCSPHHRVMNIGLTLSCLFLLFSRNSYFQQVH